MLSQRQRLQCRLLGGEKCTMVQLLTPMPTPAVDRTVPHFVGEVRDWLLTQEPVSGLACHLGWTAVRAWRTLQRVYKRGPHQRCWVHKLGNVAGTIRRRSRGRHSRRLGHLPGHESARGRGPGPVFALRWREVLSVVTFFRYPPRLWRKLRKANVICSGVSIPSRNLHSDVTSPEKKTS